MTQYIDAVLEASFTGLLRVVLCSGHQGMRKPVATPEVSSLTCTAPTEGFSHQHGSSSDGEPRSDPAPVADGCIAEALTVFRNVRLLVPRES